MGLGVSIRFPTRSRFLEPLQEGITAARHRLDEGRAVELALWPGGYGGRWFVIVDPDDRQTFLAEGSISDPTRFPQRIRAAALALALEGLHGRFLIEHDRETGIVSIRRG